MDDPSAMIFYNPNQLHSRDHSGIFYSFPGEQARDISWSGWHFYSGSGGRECSTSGPLEFSMAGPISLSVSGWWP